MKSVAMTGSFASGKSFVLKYLEKIGYKIFSCDDYVKQLYLDLNVQ
jgi:dephospho-CoA kinase